MPYWTKGVVTFRASNPNTILINPATDYQVIHDAVKYTIFVGTLINSESKKYLADHSFEIHRLSLEPLLIRAAFNNTCLRIAINDDEKVTEVEIPARS
jgi:hypothetical protein